MTRFCIIATIEFNFDKDLILDAELILTSVERNVNAYFTFAPYPGAPKIDAPIDEPADEPEPEPATETDVSEPELDEQEPEAEEVAEKAEEPAEPKKKK